MRTNLLVLLLYAKASWRHMQMRFAQPNSQCHPQKNTHRKPREREKKKSNHTQSQLGSEAGKMLCIFDNYCPSGIHRRGQGIKGKLCTTIIPAGIDRSRSHLSRVVFRLPLGPERRNTLVDLAEKKITEHARYQPFIKDWTPVGWNWRSVGRNNNDGADLWFVVFCIAISNASFEHGWFRFRCEWLWRGYMASNIKKLKNQNLHVSNTCTIAYNAVLYSEQVFLP